jgi:hypothetical protein
VNFADPSGLSQSGHPLAGGFGGGTTTSSSIPAGGIPHAGMSYTQIGGPSIVSSPGALSQGLNINIGPRPQASFAAQPTNINWSFRFDAATGTSGLPGLGQSAFASPYSGSAGGSTYAGLPHTGMSFASLSPLFQLSPGELAQASAFAELTGAGTASNILDVPSLVSPEGVALRQYMFEQSLAAIDARNNAVEQQYAADAFYAEIGRQALVRAGGALQIGQAVGEYAPAATLAAAPDATLTKAAGWGVAVHATDVLQAGFNSLFFGTSSGTFGSEAVRTVANGGLTSGAVMRETRRWPVRGPHGLVLQPVRRADLAGPSDYDDQAQFLFTTAPRARRTLRRSPPAA